MSKKFITKTPEGAFYVVRRDANGRLQWAGPFGSRGAAKQSNCHPKRGDIIVEFGFVHPPEMDRLLNQAIDDEDDDLERD